MLELPPDFLKFAHMILKDVSFAEEALALPAPERAGLARLLVESLEGDSRSDEDVRRDLQLRFQSLRTGADAGMTFEQVFGEAL